MECHKWQMHIQKHTNIYVHGSTSTLKKIDRMPMAQNFDFRITMPFVILKKCHEIFVSFKTNLVANESVRTSNGEFS